MSAPKMGGPAFPVPMMLDDHGNLHHSGEHPDRIGGMTLWDYYAAAALPSVISAVFRKSLTGRDGLAVTENDISQQAAEFADAMLAERNKRMGKDDE